MSWNAQDQGLSLERLGLTAGASSRSEPDHEFSLVEPQTVGATTDGSKRPENSPAGNPFLKRSALSVEEEADSVEGGGHTFTELESQMTPYHMSHSTLPPTLAPDLIDSSELPAFPRGVSTLDMWGDTVIAFGQYAKANKTYHELWNSSDPQCQSYIRWCQSRSKSAKGQLLDLCNYLIHVEAIHPSMQGPVIPGTSLVRQFKKA